MTYIVQAEVARRSRWIDRDDLLSTAMALFCIGMLALDVYGLSNQWSSFGTLFYLTCLALLVLLPSNIILGVLTLKNNLDMSESRRALILPSFNVLLGVAQLWLLWNMVSLLFSTLHW